MITHFLIPSSYSGFKLNDRVSYSQIFNSLSSRFKCQNADLLICICQNLEEYLNFNGTSYTLSC